MTWQERVRTHFLRNADMQSTASDHLTGPLQRASEGLVHCLLQGNKILCVGSGVSSANARYMASLLLNRHERERPGLPALALPVDNPGLSGFDADHTRQIRTLGQPGDALVLLTDSQHGSAGLSDIISAAHDREMLLLVLDDEESSQISDLLESEDLEIRAPADSPAGCRELHLSIIHCLCDLIDVQIFGDEL